ncbi:NAD(P)-dependent oxidoreductase [Paucilactobacillus kaifaensis]|uniref:NAD(P)-dependent oxidoreductase n=1 Tax=Paucilactobacillus kaifaensis TaxID=2559921 RepID=UPI0010FA4467|nr:NAD(P)-dependent oxidoreductase [Paucilactobacillus kaifaensis]
MSDVYLSAQLPTNATAILSQAGISYEAFNQPGLITKEELIQRIHSTKVLITSLSTKVDQEVINAAPKLQLIANFGAGFNNIDVAYARQKKIAVTNTPLVSTTATAELTSGLIIALARRIVEGDQVMRSTGFNGWAPLYFLGHELAGKTLGIIGMGGIGQAVAKRMHAFDMNIIYTQRHQLDPATEAQCSATFVSQSELLKQADIVTIHAPLSDSTHHLLAASEFTQMKSTALLINAARGPIIDEAALLDALSHQRIAGAALDVYEAEPYVADAFTKLTNVILTPHIGNATVEARDAMGVIVANNAVAIFTDQTPKYIVN